MPYNSYVFLDKLIKYSELISLPKLGMIIINTKYSTSDQNIAIIEIPVIKTVLYSENFDIII